MTVIVRTPAKINLRLSVLGRRSDRYHELDTVFMAVGIYDTVEVEPSADGDQVTVTGPYASQVPVTADNLALRGARLLATHAGLSAGVRISINKEIPVAGGMAGGSTDAAATLLACNEIWGLQLSIRQLLPLAARLGSDVAFPLLGGVARGTGRGETLTPIESATGFHWVLGSAQLGLSTPSVFEEYDRLSAERPTRMSVTTDTDALTKALRGADPAALAAAIERANDLQSAALSLRPELAQTLKAGITAGAFTGLVSGSGPTCAFLAESGRDARKISAALAASGTCHEVRMVRGPVEGCRVVSEGPR